MWSIVKGPRSAQPTAGAVVFERKNFLENARKIPVIPDTQPPAAPVESFWDALPEFFAWLGGAITPVAVTA